MNIAAFAKTPYVTTVNSSGRQIEGSQGYWGKFTDPFDLKFGESVERSVKARKGTETDPFCVGYFVDNEISWGEAGSLAKAALLSPKDQPVKAAYIAWLKEKYGDIGKFNAAWQVKLDGWDALEEQAFETPKNDAANEDSNAFYTVICEKYFAEVADAVHRSAPGKLYLGCRFAWTNDLARAAAQKYCDVVSYNFYKREIGDFKPVEGEDKPVIIGEFHFGALDRGMFHTGLVPCDDQNGRANAYTFPPTRKSMWPATPSGCPPGAWTPATAGCRISARSPMWSSIPRPGWSRRPRSPWRAGAVRAG